MPGGASGGARRSAASRLGHLSEAPLHGPTMRIRITDMATGIQANSIAIQPTATVIRPTVTAMDQGVQAMAMGQAPPVILKAWHTAVLEISDSRLFSIIRPRFGGAFSYSRQFLTTTRAPCRSVIFRHATL